MKRLLAMLLCLSLMITSLSATVVFAEDSSDSSDSSDGSGSTDSTEQQTEPEDDHNDLVDGLMFPEGEDLTRADKMALINSASLEPVVTHYEPLDTIVSSILSEIIEPDMDTYEKVVAIFDYLRTGTKYDYDYEADDEITSAIYNSVYYKNIRDYNIVSDAYWMLTKNSGKCKHFSGAFVVLTRAVGLESYMATCTNSSTGLGGHFSAMMKLAGGLYYFDPVMGVVMEISGDMTGSSYFCYPMQNSKNSEYSYLKEQLNYFGKFELQDEPITVLANKPKGKTLGDKHFTLGTYPQTRVTDSELIDALNEQLNGVEMNQYPYSYGSGTYDSMVKSSYMSWADITYENEKYRVVKIDDYRPKFIYSSQSKEYSMQSVTGYVPGNIYWFRFEPIEWRLTDDSNLLVADLALDSQPFNDELHLCEEGKVLNGRRHYIFKDADFTMPANDWEVSYIREWLNNDFYNTAFTAEEQELILDTRLDPNYGVNNYFDYASTTDKVFLLSYDELMRSEYYLKDSSLNKITPSTDYAQSQGACSKHSKKYGVGTTWLLRNPGIHSEDITVADNKGTVHAAISAGCASLGIRPAIRASSLSALIPETLSSPSRLTATATETGQITLKAAVSNGADYYKFYCYSGDSSEPDRVITSDNPRLVINDLTPGSVYRFRVSAARINADQSGIEETALTAETSEKCKTFVEAPESFTAEPSGTGKIKIKVDPVEGAVAYNIYRYIDADTMIVCGTTENNELELDGFFVGSTYAFWASSLSDDGYESDVSDAKAKCVCVSIPERPAHVAATPAATDKITVSWDKVEDADLYKVYRFKNDGYILLGSTSDTSFTDSGLNVDGVYIYRVQALTADEEQGSILSYSARCKCISIPPAPEDVIAEPSKTGELTLSWRAVDSADLYRVEIYDTTLGEYKELGVTDEPSYAVSDLRAGLTYSFLVSAETADGIHKSVKRWVRGTCMSIPPKPENITATPTATGEITVSWDAVEGAAGYNVYRYFNPDNIPLLGTTDETSLTVSDFSVGSLVFFKVEAVSEDGKDVSVMSAAASATCVSIPERPGNVTASAADTPYTIDLTWDKVEDATGYYVYKYDSEKQDYIYVDQTEDTSYRFSDMSSSATSSFKVAAVRSDTPRLHISALSSSVSARANRLSAPADLIATATKTGELTLSWSPSLGADQYRVQIYDSALEDYTDLGLTTETSYTVPDLKVGNKYTFAVTAESFNGEYTSLTSKVRETCSSIPPQPVNITATPTATGEITVNWDAVEGAAGYNVYRYFNPDNIPLLGSTDTTSFTLSDISIGATIFFKVEAVSADGSDISIMSAAASATCVSIPERPDNVTAAATDIPYTIDLTWDAVNDATGYYVYRYDSDKQDFVYVDQTADTHYHFEDMSSSVTSAFKVAAVKSDETRIHISTLSASVSARANRLSAPADLIATATKTGELTLSWSPSLGADQYRVQIYDSAIEDYTDLGLTTETSYTVPGLKVGSKYTFAVTAESFNGEYTSLTSKVRETCSSIPPQPVNITAAPTATGEITVNWDAVEGAATYNVYRYYNPDNIPLLGSTDKTSFTLSDIAMGATIFFKVEAVSADGSDISIMSAAASATCVSIPETPDNLIASPANDPHAIYLSWDAVEDATGYFIYKYDSAKQDYFFLDQTEDTHYQTYGYSHLLTSTFKVAAIKSDPDRLHISSLSKAAATKADRITPPVDLRAAATATGEITLSWSPVQGADRYDVYLYDATDKLYKLAASSNTAECAVDGLKTKATHTFRITSVAVFGDTEYESVLSEKITCKALSGPDQVKNLRAESSNGGVKLTWDPVSGATRYIIYRANITAQSPHEAVGSTTDNIFTAGMLEPGTVYSFYVVGANETDTATFLGTPSNTIIASTPVIPTQTETTEPTQPETAVPTQPETAVPTQPETAVPTQPETAVPTQPETAVPTQPETTVPTQPETAVPTQPETTEPTQPETTVPTQPETAVPTQPETAVPTQPETTVPTQPETAVPTQPETTVPTQPETTVPTQPATVAPTEIVYKLGDVDGNGEVDLVDSTYIQRHATMIRVPLALEMLMRGDVDGDSTLTVVDATFIMRFCTFVKTPYPIGALITVK